MSDSRKSSFTKIGGGVDVMIYRSLENHKLNYHSSGKFRGLADPLQMLRGPRLRTTALILTYLL